MAYYCSDCVTWINSSDANRYGEKWCDYDRKYRSKDQNIYGCKGFVWARRTILTKILEILNIEKKGYFEEFDVAREVCLTNCGDTMINYNFLGPMIAKYMDNDPEKKALAETLLKGFIIPAEARIKLNDCENAIKIYRDMVDLLCFRYGIFLETFVCMNECKHLIKTDQK